MLCVFPYSLLLCTCYCMVLWLTRPAWKPQTVCNSRWFLFLCKKKGKRKKNQSTVVISEGALLWYVCPMTLMSTITFNRSTPLLCRVNLKLLLQFFFSAALQLTDYRSEGAQTTTSNSTCKKRLQISVKWLLNVLQWTVSCMLVHDCLVYFIIIKGSWISEELNVFLHGSVVS